MAHQLVTGPDDGPQGSGLVAEGLQDPQPVGPQAQVLGDQLGVTGVRLGPRQDLAVSPRLDRVRLHRGDGVARLQQRVDEPAIGPFDRHGHAHRCAQLGQPLGEPFNAISTVGHRERADLDAARIEYAHGMFFAGPVDADEHHRLQRRHNLSHGRVSFLWSDDRALDEAGSRRAVTDWRSAALPSVAGSRHPGEWGAAVSCWPSKGDHTRPSPPPSPRPQLNPDSPHDRDGGPVTTPAGPTPRYAWYGRVSTEDEQDPTLSFPRQLQNAERQVAESGGRIVCHYYDIESGTRAYAARGSGGLAGFEIPIPRDGGLQDLLADAAKRPARFDRVIVESISRLSRNSSVAFRVEDELRQAGVRLCAADEPLEESFGTIVLRHVNIGIARGYHHELMVKSRQGQETSTRQGWHTGGVALYGYRFVTHDHPNPHKASRGINKRTLELDPVRAPVVRAIYDWYLGGGVGLLQIRDRLYADPDRYPPPVPVDPTTARGAWSRSSVWEVLRNPKYTGYQVWNRRARKKGHNRTNPPEMWVWSDEPAHPAIVTREEYDAVQGRAKANERSRQAVPATVARPTAKRDYL